MKVIFFLACYGFMGSFLMADVTLFQGGKVLRNHAWVEEDFWVSDSVIVHPQTRADHIVELGGKSIAPGYIDIQINGAFGVDFSCQAERVHEVAKQLPQYGVTGFLPTLVSLPQNRYPSLLPHLQPKRGGKIGASILGIHLEGPFFSVSKAGAHNSSAIQTRIPPLCDFYGDLEGVKIITLAPELSGSIEAIEYAKSRGIVVSMGHSSSSYQEALLAIKTGAGLVTHLFNAMSPLSHRSPGLVGAALTQPIYYSIIADGVHLNDCILDLAWRSNPDGLILITDAIEALGKPKGHYHLGVMAIDVQEQGAFLEGTNTLAGSVLSLDEAVRHFKRATGCSSIEAIEAASLKPAQLLGISSKGHLTPGADADFNILNEALEIQSCYVSGELSWER